MNNPTGSQIYQWVTDLFPICRSLTGRGTLESLQYFAQMLPDFKIKSIASGTKVYDWTVPNEWNIQDAYIKDSDGVRIVDFKKSNLHVMGYSTPLKATLSFEELEPHLFSLPGRPDAIPYITSYYKENWGFCVTHRQLEKLKRSPKATYDVCIDSELAPGQLNYGELVIPGEQKDEILFSSYLCHPSMANNELSGPAVMTALALWINGLPSRKYTYRFLFLVETIGAIAYLSRNLQHLQKHVHAGFVLSCVGDERAASHVESRNGNTLADRLTRQVLKHRHPDYKTYSYLLRGSDERQYCHPGVDLPVCTVCRSKFAEYPEYHTSDDNLDLVTPKGLEESLEIFKDIVLLAENNAVPKCKILCEPQLGKRGLYPDTSTLESAAEVYCLSNLISYADGNRDLIAIAEHIGEPATRLIPILERLVKEKIVEI